MCLLRDLALQVIERRTESPMCASHTPDSPEAASGTAEAHDCRREQDAAASSTCVVAQSDGTLRLSGYVGGGAVSEFNAEEGVYTASVDGMYSVCALSSQPLSSDIGFLTLVHSHASGATSVHTHIDPARYEGGLMHLRAHDTLCVVASCADSGSAASTALKCALTGLSVSLRIELAMRKRKRVADLDDLDEKEAEAAATARRKRAAAEVDDETGSDTEWSEGFSSDDEAKRARRPPKKVRALARAARELDCTEAEASGSVSPDGHAAG